MYDKKSTPRSKVKVCLLQMLIKKSIMKVWKTIIDWIVRNANLVVKVKHSLWVMCLLGKLGKEQPSVE